MIKKFFAGVLCLSMAFSTPAHALTKAEAQQCVITAVNEIGSDVRRINNYLYTSKVVKDARRDWPHLSQTQKQRLVNKAYGEMMRNLKPFRFAARMLEIQVDNVRPGSPLSHATGRISILFWRNQHFSADIDGECRVRQVTVETLKDGKRTLSQWLAEEMNWQPP